MKDEKYKLATARQISVIYFKAKEFVGLSREDIRIVSVDIYGDPPELLTQHAATQLINKLNYANKREDLYD